MVMMIKRIAEIMASVEFANDESMVEVRSSEIVSISMDRRGLF